jgi:hypothetical protein
MPLYDDLGGEAGMRVLGGGPDGVGEEDDFDGETSL